MDNHGQHGKACGGTWYCLALGGQAPHSGVHSAGARSRRLKPQPQGKVKGLMISHQHTMCPAIGRGSWCQARWSAPKSRHHHAPSPPDNARLEPPHPEGPLVQHRTVRGSVPPPSHQMCVQARPPLALASSIQVRRNGYLRWAPTPPPPWPANSAALPGGHAAAGAVPPGRSPHQALIHHKRSPRQCAPHEVVTAHDTATKGQRRHRNCAGGGVGAA